jgi:hypothetical protein
MLLIVLASCKVNYKIFAIDSETGEIVNEDNLRISCTDKKAEEYYCLSGEDLIEVVRNCRKRSEKAGDISRP